jgi:hypothetical protein
MGREFEVKLLAENIAYNNVSKFLKEQLASVCVGFHEGTSIDAYWRAAPEAKGSFLRLRVNDKVTLTSKINDKQSIADREEFNVDFSINDKEAALELLSAALGEPTCIMWKYINFNLGNGTTISAVKNLEKPEFTFIEIEAVVMQDVLFWQQRLSTVSETNLKQVKNSFYDIFVLRQGVLL